MADAEKRPDKPRRPWYKRWWAVLLVLPGLALGLGGLLLFFFLFAAVPLPDDVGAGATIVLDRHGNEIGTLQPQVARTDIALADVPDHAQKAVLAAEDRRFYGHRGVSPTGVVRALFTNIRAGGIEQGGSTITQQYVKNALTGADRTFLRKAKEAALAVKMERRFDKDQILEFYLNTIYWGRGAYGIEAAARTYYGVPAAQLDLNMAATLAGIIQAPEALDPRENPEGVNRRRLFVLDGMLAEGWIDQATHDQVANTPISLTTDRQTVEYGPNAYYLDAVRRRLATLLGDEKEVFQGLRVATELEPAWQATAQRVVTEHTAGKSYGGALVSIDPTDGGVRALVGGPDFARQQLNVAIRTSNTPGRGPGSAFKPFTLATFIEQGGSPESRFEAPACIDVPSGDGTKEVCNYSRRHEGTKTVRQATWSSTNTVYMQVTEETSPEAIVDMAHQLGIPQEVDLPVEYSLTLGTGSVTPEELATGYATLAAGGVHSEPRLIRTVERDGEVLFDLGPQRTSVYRANDAHLVTDVLRGVIERGTGQAAAIGRPAAGKTGTTQEYKDAWFAGYVPQLTTVTWVGNLDNSPMADEVTGGSVPAQMFSAFMTEALADVPVEDFPEPDPRDKKVHNAPKPSPAPSPEPSPTESPSPSPSPAPSPEPSPTESPSPSPSPSPSGEPTPSPEPSPTLSPAEEPSPSPEPSPTAEPSPT